MCEVYGGYRGLMRLCFQMTAITMSAILCTQPGSGELLMAYPQTGVSTSQTLETMRMQLRVYLGAAVYNPDHYSKLNVWLLSKWCYCFLTGERLQLLSQILGSMALSVATHAISVRQMNSIPTSTV